MGRTYVAREMAKGRTGNEIFADGTCLVHGILALRLEAEQRLPADEVVFLDRSTADGLTYCRVHGLDPNEILAQYRLTKRKSQPLV
jgi:predicted ATPase